MRVVVLLLVFILSLSARDNELYVYNWSEYMPKSILEDFSKDTGIKIRYFTYDSNEEMYKKVKSSKVTSYDIIFPSTYFISKMSREGLLAKIDKSKIPNYKNLDPKLLSNDFDPANDYSIPYLWGTTGITYNTAGVYGNIIDSWADLWDTRYKKSILLNDDMREVFGMTLKVLGYSTNSTDPEEIKEAYHKLLELKPNIKVYSSESQKQYYLDDEVQLGMSFNGEGFSAKKDDDNDKFLKLIFDGELSNEQEKKKLVYIYPSEGAIVWMDSLVISKKSKNIDNAHLFINYILKAEVAKSISQKLGYASPNTEAIELLSRSVTRNRTIYPNKEDLKNSEYQTDVGEALAIYTKYWEMLREE